jgi:hypothetical protein
MSSSRGTWLDPVEGSDVLLAITEVSIAFAGFTSIVGVIGHRMGEPWSPENSLRLWLMIESSLASLFFSLLPFVLHYLSFREAMVWGVSSGTMTAFLLLHSAVVGRKLRTLYVSDQWSTRRIESLVGALIFATIAVQSLNVLGIGFHRNLGAYLLGLILLLALASMHFVALLIVVHSSMSRADD